VAASITSIVSSKSSLSGVAMKVEASLIGVFMARSVLGGWNRHPAFRAERFDRDAVILGVLCASLLDVRTFDGRHWRGRVDVVSGGFPCQDISSAGKGAGIDGERSGMWMEMARIVGEVRPRYVFVENSPILTSRGLGVVLGDLAALGYHARWGVLGASDAGACHERKRIWIIAYHPNEIGSNGGEIQGQLFIPTESPKRQFERAIDAAPSSLADSHRLGDSFDVAGWMDRLAAIGNGQVPSVAALAWRILSGDT